MSEARAIGMGCMRLSTDPDADGGRAVETIRAAVDAGVSLLDTAGAYADNERLVARAVAGRDVTVVTKGGMRRPKGRWVPDGRRGRLLADAEASREALEVDALDLFLIHAPDPSTEWKTSARALEAIRGEGIARRVGLSNVSRPQLEEARAHAEISAVQVALGIYHEDAVRGGVVERCLELGIDVLAHSPLGGPKGAAKLARRHPELADLAAARGVEPGTLALAWLYDLHPRIVPLPGARRPATARAAAEAAKLALRDDEREALDRLFPIARLLRTPRAARRPSRPRAEVVLLAGIPGAGKSTRARVLEARGYERLNRDERGGSLAKLAARLGERLEAGVARVVMDATYATRAQRNRVIEAAWARGAIVRCVWIDTPLEDAQINAVDRMLERHGELLGPERIAREARRDPNTFGPRAQYRLRDAFEPPSADEGLSSVERVPFARRRPPGHDRPGWIVDLARVQAEPDLLASRRADERVLVLGWLPGASDDEIAALATGLGEVDVAVCVHAAGPPRCWCRKPLPGLPIAWMRAHRIDPGKTRYSGSGAADRTLAGRLGVAEYDG